HCDGLTQVGIKSPGSRPVQDALPKRAPSSRLRILKHDLIEFGIHNRIQRAERAEVLRRRHRRALRVLRARILAGRPKISGAGGAAPVDANGFWIEWTDHIWSS